MSFINEKAIKAVRKAHRCEGCWKRIDLGQPAINWAGLVDCDFHSNYYHPECRAAEIALNALRDTGFHDDWNMLHEADREEYPWLKKEHPVAYLRLVSSHAKVPECEHVFDGWRVFDDGHGGEKFCQKCGLGAMAHTLSNCP
jgi:hypothetical protein